MPAQRYHRTSIDYDNETTLSKIFFTLPAVLGQARKNRTFCNIPNSLPNNDPRLLVPKSHLAELHQGFALLWLKRQNIPTFKESRTSQFTRGAKADIHTKFKKILAVNRPVFGSALILVLDKILAECNKHPR